MNLDSKESMEKANLANDETVKIFKEQILRYFPKEKAVLAQVILENIVRSARDIGAYEALLAVKENINKK